MDEPINLDAVIRELRILNELVPKPMRLPTPQEVKSAEEKLGIQFHPDYRRFLLEASDAVVGVLEPATLTIPGDYTDLMNVCETAWKNYGVPKELLPICEDNGDFFCMNTHGEVVFWSHNGWTSEKWPNLASWIKDVWIGESS